MAILIIVLIDYLIRLHILGVTTHKISYVFLTGVLMMVNIACPGLITLDWVPTFGT